jgi:VanZ family protein
MREQFYLFAPLFFWTIIIFIASSNLGSMSNTSRIIRPILEFLFPAADENTLQIIHAYVRKTAHLTFYFILGFLAARAFCLSGIFKKYGLLTAFALVVVIAALDEWNQSFLASRTSSVYDVGLDAIGGTTALLFFLIFRSFFKRK